MDLARVVADIAATSDLGVLAKVVTSNAAEVLGADTASLCVLEEDGSLRLVGLRSAAPVDPAGRRLAAQARHPMAEAVRAGTPVAASTREEIDRRWPGLFGPDAVEHSLACLPLLAGSRCVGAVGLGFPTDGAPSANDRQYLGTLADSCAQAIDRIEATAAAASAAARLRFLADASATLSVSLDYEDTLRGVADLAVPVMADWCAIDLLEDGAFRRVAVSHVDPEKVALAHRLWERFPPQMDAPTGAPAVVRTGVPELIEDIDAELLDRLEVTGELRQLVEDLQLHSTLTVPLRARGRTLGVLSFVYAESGRAYGAADISFVEDLARRAALAIDNAELHTETLQVALQLQRAVLPETFPHSGQWQVAAHYRPAGRTEVGGDFYDALPLPDGRLVALVGDVMGRGVQAASAMAQVRAAIRAYVALDPDPTTVLRRVDTMFKAFDMSQLVTLCYALFDPAAGRCGLICAGHLPPMLVRPGGDAELAPVEGTPPLGLADGDRPVTSVPFGSGEVLLGFTDGLVERRGEDLDDGIGRLRELAGAVLHRFGDDALRGLADELRSAGHDDDVTLLAVRCR